MSDYAEHLISMAGGDGDEVDQRALVREQARRLRAQARKANDVVSIAVRLEGSDRSEDRKIAEDLYAALRLT